MTSHRNLIAILWLLVLGLLAACSPAPTPTPTAVPTQPPMPTHTPSPTATYVPSPTPIPPPSPTPKPAVKMVTAPLNPPTYTYEIINIYPHDPAAFTQGLVFVDGILYEGTGLKGRSAIRKTDLETGEVLQKLDLAPAYFGEGITVWQDRLIQITWRSGMGFIYDLTTFEQQDTFQYPGEGWGLTHDGRQLIMSDGTNEIRFLDPDTLAENGRIQIYDPSGPIVNLNELEYVNGEIWANIWKTNRIARIDPATGQVVGWIDLTGLLNPATLIQPVDVLNGIAYDTEEDRLFVTGKLWPNLFEIKVIQEPNS